MSNAYTDPAYTAAHAVFLGRQKELAWWYGFKRIISRSQLRSLAVAFIEVRMLERKLAISLTTVEDGCYYLRGEPADRVSAMLRDVVNAGDTLPRELASLCPNHGLVAA